jgi:predicted O-methyltransferase YrrM
MAYSDIDARYIAEFADETKTQLTARSLAHEHGVSVIPPATGAHYATLAAATGAQNIAEVGTAFGVSGLWLLRGAPGAVLTSIDDGYDRQEQAKPLFAEAGFAVNQIRLITGRASDVLPRLNENSYDVVVIDGDPAHVSTYVQHALRLVRVGGVVMVPHVLWKGEVADPTKRGAVPAAFRKMLTDVRNTSDVVFSMSPLGDGLLTITKVATDHPA